MEKALLRGVRFKASADYLDFPFVICCHRSLCLPPIPSAGWFFLSTSLSRSSGTLSIYIRLTETGWSGDAGPTAQPWTSGLNKRNQLPCRPTSLRVPVQVYLLLVNRERQEKPTVIDASRQDLGLLNSCLLRPESVYESSDGSRMSSMTLSRVRVSHRPQIDNGPRLSDSRSAEPHTPNRSSPHLTVSSLGPNRKKTQWNVLS